MLLQMQVWLMSSALAISERRFSLSRMAVSVKKGLRIGRCDFKLRIGVGIKADPKSIILATEQHMSVPSVHKDT